MDLKLINLVNNGKNSPTLSKFLTINEQNELIKYKSEVNIIFSENYDEEVRKRAFIYPKDMDITPNFKISYLKIHSKHKLRHPDILGAIMSLGIVRDVIGDIIVGDEYYIIIASEIEKYILENLLAINKASVTLEKVEELNVNNEDNYQEASIIVSSLRLDGIISKAINLSRDNATELIRMRLVKINGNVETRNDYRCKENDIISITKHGRIIVLNISRKTKKEKLVLNILKTK